MALKIGSIGIIADDLTGANDTALQFLLRGCNTQILFDPENIPEGCNNTVVWAINTESRNLDPGEAKLRVNRAAEVLKNELQVDFLYKKIDSTLRGNVALEALDLLESNHLDAAIVVPAFPDEGRTTVGGYHLLRGLPLERTEVARDPNFPIYISHIPTLLANQCQDPDIVAHITLSKVMRGAAPILRELQEYIKNGKKLIVIDAVSNVDLDQIVLAMEKCMGHSEILPCGSAGLASAITKSWMPDGKYQHILKVVPQYPTLIVAGSVTPITRTQVKLLQDHKDEYKLKVYNLSAEQLINGLEESLINEAKASIEEGFSILIYSAPTDASLQESADFAELKNIKRSHLSLIVQNRLADFARIITDSTQVKLVLIGGETANACCKAIGSAHLQLIDEVDHAIPLCLDQKAQFIITKSGNLGTPKTLINIMNYFKDNCKD